ncbi:hypothetical protein CVAR21S_01657 [Corynebacterium variabile]
MHLTRWTTKVTAMTSRTDATPASPTPPSPVRELTTRAIIIGGLITLVFTAANVYLGL